MPIAIIPTVDTAPARFMPGSTRAYSASANSGSEVSTSGQSVLIASRMERLAQNYGASRAGSDARSLGGGQEEQFGASELRYSTAEGATDYGSNVDRVGGPFETIEKVLTSLRRMGQDAVLAQANQLPTGAQS